MRSSLPTSHYFKPLPRPGVSPANNPLPPTGKSDFVSQFEFVGSVDNGPFLCVPEALRFRREVCGGEEAIMNYCFDLARDGGRLVAQILGTEVMDNEDHTLTHQCCMVNVRLPLEVVDDRDEVNESSKGVPASDANTIAIVPSSQASTVTHFLTSACVTEYSTFIALIFYRNAWWARFSAQIYLELADFEYGAQVLKTLCQKVAQQSYAPTLPNAAACS
jgi:hercynylcysteine S-oxide lyase